MYKTSAPKKIFEIILRGIKEDLIYGRLYRIHGLDYSVLLKNVSCHLIDLQI